MKGIFDSRAPQKPIDVSINSDLLEKARGLNINLSATLEAALAERVRAEEQKKWKKDNAKAIQAYNRFIEEHGVYRY